MTLNDLITSPLFKKKLTNRQLPAALSDCIHHLAQQTDIIHTQFQQIRLDSRQVHQNDMFVLLASQSGQHANSATYALKVAKKAAFILSEVAIETLVALQADLANYQHKILYVPRIREYLGDLIRVYLAYEQNDQQKDQQKDCLSLPQQNQHPQNQQLHTLKLALPKVIAITGTNGKTTISQLVAQLTQASGMVSAVMGTAGNGKLGQLVQASHTTADVLAVHTFLHQMENEAVQLLALEASSHGLDQHRLQGVPIQVAIYTNLSRDHLDYHRNMDEYARAKARLFDRNYFTELTHAIINLDDEHAPIMLETASASGVENIWTYTLNPNKTATFKAQQITPSLTGVEIELVTNPDIAGTLWLNSPLLGRFNVANLVAAVAGLYAIKTRTPELLEQWVAELQGADGRMQRVASSTGCFIVDYAHTPDALVQVLTSLKAHCDGELWAVFGCGGDRDTGKRPLMAQAGLTHADRVILTSDNPRSEDPADILQDMQQGMTDEQYSRTHIEADRKTAIAYAVQHAKENDIVVIAGKGHETYQEIQGVRYDFDDRVVLKECLQVANKK